MACKLLMKRFGIKDVNSFLVILLYIAICCHLVVTVYILFPLKKKKIKVDFWVKSLTLAILDLFSFLFGLKEIQTFFRPLKSSLYFLFSFQWTDSRMINILHIVLGTQVDD
jgi:hypothetical protein